MKHTAIFATLLVGAMAEVQPSSDPKYPETVAYFGIKDDLSKLKWAHAVNSKAELEKALADKTIQMIEADVRAVAEDPSAPEAGKREETTLIAVMKHDEATKHDITLKDFVEKIVEHIAKDENNGRRLGLKLDFKTKDAFEAAVKLTESFDKVTFPLWINADVLPGPGKTEASEADITDSKEAFAGVFKDAVYSFGWTTADYPQGAKAGENLKKYTAENVKEMLKKIEEINGTFTFPVRAIYAANSVEELKGLLEKRGDTLTVWSPDAETPAFTDGALRGLMEFMAAEKSKVYLDVPASLQTYMDKLNGAGSLVPVSLMVFGLVSGLLINYF